MNLFLFILLPWLLIFHICCILHSSQLPTIMAHSVSTGYAYASGDIRGSRPEIFLRKGILKLCSKFPGQSPSLGVISLRGSEGGVGWWRTLSRPIAFGAPISLTWLCNCPATAGHSKICSFLKNQLQNRYPSLRLSGPIIFHDLVTCGSNEDYKISSSHYWKSNHETERVIVSWSNEIFVDWSWGVFRTPPNI